MTDRVTELINELRVLLEDKTESLKHLNLVQAYRGAVERPRPMLYQIEQDPRDPAPWYDGLGLPACKARARRLSKTSSCHVYILCYRDQKGPPVGQIVFADGRFEYTAGEIA